MKARRELVGFLVSLGFLRVAFGDVLERIAWWLRHPWVSVADEAHATPQRSRNVFRRDMNGHGLASDLLARHRLLLGHTQHRACATIMLSCSTKLATGTAVST